MQNDPNLRLDHDSDDEEQMARLRELEDELLGENKMKKQISMKVPKSSSNKIA